MPDSFFPALWRKSWLETRFRLLLGLLLSVYILYLICAFAPAALLKQEPAMAAPELGRRIWKLFLIAYGTLTLPITSKILAGAGINAQTSMGMSRGFHGSMSYLLSMPVARWQILAVRAGLGAVALVGVGSLTFAAYYALVPRYQIALPPTPAFPVLAAVLLVAMVFYCLAVLLSAIFDEFWAGTIGLLLLGFVLGAGIALPQSVVDLEHFLQNPTMGTTLLYLACCVVFLFATVRLIDNKEY